MADLKQLCDAVINGDQKTAVAVTEEALAETSPPMELINGYMIPAMDEVGRRFEGNEYFVPELLIAARAMKGALGLLRPAAAAKGRSRWPRGDRHGKGRPARHRQEPGGSSMLEGGGFEVSTWASTCRPRSSSRRSGRRARRSLACPRCYVTMPSMKKTIDALKEAGVRDSVKVIIGGAPITRQYADEIGADGYSDNASVAGGAGPRGGGGCRSAMTRRALAEAGPCTGWRCQSEQTCCCTKHRSGERSPRRARAPGEVVVACGAAMARLRWRSR